jgi:hypothetical protein
VLSARGFKRVGRHSEYSRDSEYGMEKVKKRPKGFK